GRLPNHHPLPHQPGDAPPQPPTGAVPGADDPGGAAGPAGPRRLMPNNPPAADTRGGGTWTMTTTADTIQTLAKREYKYGFVTDIETESAPPGLNEEIIRFIWTKKGEPDWMLDWRLKAYRHWQTMQEPT